MNTFLIIAAVMAAIAAAAVALPLLRDRQSRIQGALMAVLVVGAAAGLYPLWSNWNWHAPPANPAAGGAGGPDVAAMVARLEQHLRDQPDDLKGWLMLGRSYLALDRIRRCRDRLRSCAPSGRPECGRGHGPGRGHEPAGGRRNHAGGVAIVRASLGRGAQQSQGAAVRRFCGGNARRPGTGAHAMAGAQETCIPRRKSSKCWMRASRNWVRRLGRMRRLRGRARRQGA